MTPRFPVTALLVLAGVFLANSAFSQPKTVRPLPKPGTKNFALEVLTRFDDLYRGDKSESVMEMAVVTKHWRRTLKLRSWSLGKDYSLVRILAPKKERGTATLKSGKDLYTWLGKIGRLIKVGGGMMGGAWMGSHFTNDDLVRETRLSEDFVIKQLPDGKKGGQATWVFELTARPNAAVVWGKVVITLRQTDGLPVTQQFYDEESKLVRTMAFSDFKTLGGRVMPTTMKMLPRDRAGESTTVRILEQDFNPKIDRSFFSLGRLKSM